MLSLQHSRCSINSARMFVTIWRFEIERTRNATKQTMWTEKREHWTYAHVHTLCVCVCVRVSMHGMVHNVFARLSLLYACRCMSTAFEFIFFSSPIRLPVFSLFVLGFCVRVHVWCSRLHYSGIWQQPNAHNGLSRFDADVW